MKKVKRLISIISIFAILLTSFTGSVYAATTLSAPEGGAYSIGGEFHNGADIISACDFWALCGYSSYYNDNPSYSYVNSNRLNAYILYFSAHGNQNAIYLPNNIIVSNGRITATSKTINIKNYNLNRAKLYVYDACQTASNANGSGVNLCTVTRDAGADCVIGWKQNIGVSDAFAWQKRFQNRLALGHTVQNAANYANGFSYDNNSTIKSWQIFGNKNLIIKISHSAALENNYIETDKYKYVDCSSKKYSMTNYVKNQNTLNGIIKDNFVEFNPSDYKKTYTYTNEEKSDYVIDYTYMIGEYSTRSGYSVIVNDNKVVGIQENNMDIENHTRKSIPNFSELSKMDAYEEAQSKVSARSDNSTIVEQYGEPFYDASTDTFGYRLMTVYKTEAGGYGAFFTFSK